MFLILVSVQGQNFRVQGYAEKGGQTVTVAGITTTSKYQQSFPGCTVKIYNAGTLTLSTIYSNSSGTPKSNPFTAASDGYFFFYAATGTYDIQFSGTGIASPFTWGDYNNGGSGGGGGGGVQTFILPPTADPGQANTSTVTIFRGADSTLGTALDTFNPGTYLQVFRTGGTHGVGQFGFLRNFQMTGVDSSDSYAFYDLSRITPDMTGTAAGSYFHDGYRSYIILNPQNITTQNIAGYAGHFQGERGVTGVRVMSLNLETHNSTSSDAAVAVGSIDTTFGFATSWDGTSHNTGIWYAEGPLNSLAGYFGAYFDSNSLVQRVFDTTATTFTLQGLWSATNGSTAVSGSGGHANVEVVAGDYLLINGTYARAASATANAITLASNFTGTTGTSLTITKSVQFAWLRENQPLLYLNHAGNAKKELVRYDSTDTFIFDENLVGATFKSTLKSNTNIYANNGFTQKIYIGAVAGQEIYPGVWFGNITPDLTNYAFLYDSGLSSTVVNSPGALDLRTQGVPRVGLNNIGIFYEYKGSAVASAATIVPTGNYFHVTGATGISAIDGTGIVAGTTIEIVFDSNPLLTNGANLQLAGTTNLTPTAGSMVTFKYDGTGVWKEKCRAIR